MKHYLIFHNPEKMGYPLDSVKEFTAFTNRELTNNIIGNKLWLITGEGNPKEYFLKMYFIIDDIKSGKEKNFKTKLIGNDGKILEKKIRIDNSPWFEEFRKQMAFFVGFAEIKHQEYIDELEKLA